MGDDAIRVSGRELYVWSPGGIIRSPALEEIERRRLGVVTTARNWSTVLKLRAMLGASHSGAMLAARHRAGCRRDGRLRRLHPALECGGRGARESPHCRAGRGGRGGAADRPPRR